jgi:hypothetical protein
MPSITQIFSCLEKRMKKGNKQSWLTLTFEKEWRKETTVVIDEGGSSLLSWSFLIFSFLANYLWITQLPLTKWRNNFFLSSSNHVVILSLFFLFLISHQSHQSIFLYFLHQYLFPFSSLVFPFESCHQSRQSIFLSLKKEWIKETTGEWWQLTTTRDE